MFRLRLVYLCILLFLSACTGLHRSGEIKTIGIEDIKYTSKPSKAYVCVTGHAARKIPLIKALTASQYFSEVIPACGLNVQDEGYTILIDVKRSISGNRSDGDLLGFVFLHIITLGIAPSIDHDQWSINVKIYRDGSHLSEKTYHENVDRYMTVFSPFALAYGKDKETFNLDLASAVSTQLLNTIYR